MAANSTTKLRPDTNEQYLQSANSCANYLLDVCPRERGLFRQQSSLIEMRRLKLLLYQGIF